MKIIKLYTDGSCKGNPGPGGYCAILVYNGKEKIVSDAFRDTTNNRMELSAVIEGLTALKEPCEVEVFTDSKYVADSVKLKRLDFWQKNGWKLRNRDIDVRNRDLWERLIPLLEVHKVKFTWVKGHAGHFMNEKCDEIAKKVIDKLMALCGF